MTSTAALSSMHPITHLPRTHAVQPNSVYIQALRPDHGLRRPHSSTPRPFAPQTPPPQTLTLFACFLTTTALSDFQTITPARLWRTPFHASGFPLPMAWTSRVPYRTHPCMHRVYDSGEPTHCSHFSQRLVLPSPSPNKVGVPNGDFGAQYRACTSTCQRLT